MNKWYVHNLESIQENKTHTILWDLEIQKNNLISAGRPDLIIVTKKEKKERKKTCRIVDFTVPADHRVKLKKPKRNISS